MKKIFFLTILFLLPLISYAQEQKGINKNLENISGQYAECAAYYEIVYHAMNSSNEKETATSYKDLEDSAMFYSLLLASEGREKEMAVDVTNSRIEMYIKKMKEKTKNRNENISILINKYHFNCNELMKTPPKELNEILKRKLNKVSNQKNK